MWPWSGRMFVVVWVTIVAPVRVSTTCTEEPVIWAPFCGWTIATTAGDDGRGPSVPASDGAAVGPLVPTALDGVPEPQAASATAIRNASAVASARAAEDRERRIGDLMVAR